MSSYRAFISASVALICSMTGTLQAQPDSAALPSTQDIEGHWRSAAPERYGSHYAIRTFVLAERSWQVRYQAYADAQGQHPIFTIRVNGVYALGDASANVQGAREGIFPALSRSVTADSEAGVKMFASMGCRLERDQEKFLLNKECGFVPGLMQAMGEYDLVALNQGQLFFGDRGGDLTKARPEMLTKYPLQRTP